eukprot:CAMPEP_0205820142 /NCGR_PEP_ID=MMETSP0206-20130828/2748_1 /ASSEMBLY_ACC=CAM_ASM_000279 /TAXON_ID=36767 /ORGANISM="Euplotes focardii, Strain TN1" /LENGTH=90 /DNA_ID=CAMNT_0053114569 /DNA_START=221 /DNA_END=490 /DNA_ORIENTATION=-
MTDSEEDNEDKKGCLKPPKKSFVKRQRFKSENNFQLKSDDKPIDQRRLSYTKEMEELFIATFPVDCEIPRFRLESMVDFGLIMDESPEYV